MTDNIQGLFPTPIVYTDDDDGHVIVSPADGIGVCDFCSLPNTVWDYPCLDFDMPGGMSLGDWASCDPCSLLADKRDYTGMADSALIAHDMPKAEYMDAWREMVKTYIDFDQHQLGPKIPLP